MYRCGGWCFSPLNEACLVSVFVCQRIEWLLSDHLPLLVELMRGKVHTPRFVRGEVTIAGKRFLQGTPTYLLLQASLPLAE